MLQHAIHWLSAAACGRRLAELGIRPTVPRVRIAALLCCAASICRPNRSSRHSLQAVKRVSKATVYNTLKIFASSGLIRQLTIDDSRAWYDSNTGAHYHFHDIESGALI
jgi:Fur family iron response transcriptional regulator